MTQQQKDDITEIAKEFVSGFEGTFDSIDGTGWFIVDPLSAYLNSIGLNNTLQQYEETDKCPMVLIMTFDDGSVFIPAGADLKPHSDVMENYMWFDA